MVSGGPGERGCPRMVVKKGRNTHKGKGMERKPQVMWAEQGVLKRQKLLETFNPSTPETEDILIYIVPD